MNQDAGGDQAIRVSVRLIGELRQIVGEGEVKLEIPRGARLKDLLEVMINMHGEKFRDVVLGELDHLNEEVAIFVNGEEVRRLAGLDTTLAEGQIEIALVPLIEGG